MWDKVPILDQENLENNFLWIIQAQHYHLDKFCLQAGLGPDSAIPLIFRLEPDPFAEARLTYPGSKCRQPEAWLKVLALLYVHHISFHIYQGAGTEENIYSLTLLRPGIHRDLRAILGFAAQKKVLELQRYEELLERAFRLLSTMSGVP
ncbi:MAG: hypothetical protein ACOC0S_05215 [Desulfohalobiaceae bacterium]